MKASIGKIAKELGVSRDTLRRWEAKGKIIAERTARGHRRYDLAKILGLLPRGQSLSKNTVAYARVSSHDQKEDLTRQANVLHSFAQQDVLEIITVFSVRLYGARSRKNQKVLEALKEAAAAL